MKYKYTDYIINGNFVDINSLIPKNTYMKIITIPLASTVAIMAFLIFVCLIPMTISVDSARIMKFRYIRIKRKYHVNYVFLIPIDKLDQVLSKLHIKFSLHNEIHRNEQNMKLGLLHVRNIFSFRKIE